MRVLALMPGEPVGVVGRHDPQVDAADRVAVLEPEQQVPGIGLIAVHGRDEYDGGDASASRLTEVISPDVPALVGGADDLRLDDGGLVDPLLL